MVRRTTETPPKGAVRLRMGVTYMGSVTPFTTCVRYTYARRPLRSRVCQIPPIGGGRLPVCGRLLPYYARMHTHFAAMSVAWPLIRPSLSDATATASPMTGIGRACLGLVGTYLSRLLLAH